MDTIWSRQPFKAIYLLFFLTRVSITLIWTFIRYGPKPFRPLPQLSIKLHVTRAVFPQVFAYYTKTKTTNMANVITDHKKAKSRYAIVNPASSSQYSGIISPGVVKPVPVGGLWYPAPLLESSPNLDDEKVVIHLPGGAFVIALGTDANGQNVSHIMSRYINATRTFFAQYRLSTEDSTRFPAAIQDVLTIYHYVLFLGVKSQNIIISGDSAAGNLVVALLRYLETLNLPLPGGAMIWSPWLHVTSQAGKDYKASSNAQYDCLDSSLLQWGADAYFPINQPTSEELAYISPLHRPFRTNVPLFIHAGTMEAFFDTIKEFSDEMSGIEGNRIRFHSTEFAIHDLLLSYKGVGMEHEMGIAAADAYDFFQQNSTRS